jgi:hypothetical protein
MEHFNINTTSINPNLKINYMETEKMLSLYEYLNKAAGPDLGKDVCKAAKEKGIKLDTKEISTFRYSGKIMLYPESFLQEYFSSKEEQSTSNKSTEQDLPF